MQTADLWGYISIRILLVSGGMVTDLIIERMCSWWAPCSCMIFLLKAMKNTCFAVIGEEALTTSELFRKYAANTASEAH